MYKRQIYGFAVALGLLWLSTVPPTNGIVAGVFGTRYLAMLAGVTFFSHQIGSFLGAWLGGLLYDRTGSYDVGWWISIGLGVAAGLLNLPIDERAHAPQVAQQRRAFGARAGVRLAGGARAAIELSVDQGREVVPDLVASHGSGPHISSRARSISRRSTRAR